MLIDTHLTEYSETGLNLGRSDQAMIYAYGLADFWAYFFEDASVVNLLLETSSTQAAEIYNHFLQLCSGISLEDISSVSNSQIKLVLLSDSSLISGAVETYKLPEKIVSSRYIANRPLLPSSSLESGVDYYIDADAGTIRFARPLATNRFSFRSNADGTKDYALWMVDAKIDEQLISSNFAKLIKVADPTVTTESFRNFIYGLYYLYTGGPNIALLSKGLNLCLGIPLARDSETVLEIRTYLNTDQYLVVTDLNSYLIPYGLSPSVAVGDVLKSGDELAIWVEVKDWISDDSWWLNFMIPETMIPNSPTADRHAVAGSYLDNVMRTYLKKHSFLVNVKTNSFKNLQNFSELASILARAKPCHTIPVYVWSVSPTEIIPLDDSGLSVQIGFNRQELGTDGIYRFVRDSTNPIMRGALSTFSRNSVPRRVLNIAGYDVQTNGNQRSLAGGEVKGFFSAQAQPHLFGMSDKDQAWGRTIMTRGTSRNQLTRDYAGFSRNIPLAVDGIGVKTLEYDSANRRIVWIYTTRWVDVLNKFSVAGKTLPSKADQISLFDDSDHLTYMVNNFDVFFKRNSNIKYLNNYMTVDALMESEVKPGDLRSGDYLLFRNVMEDIFGVFWVTSNYDAKLTPFATHDADDVLSLGVSGKITRGMAQMGHPLLRLRGATDDSGAYSDSYTYPISMTRGGAQLNTTITLRS